MVDPGVPPYNANHNGSSATYVQDGSGDAFSTNSETYDDMLGDTRHVNRKVTFSDSEPRVNGRPSVPGPSNYLEMSSSRSMPDRQFTENLSRQMRVPHQIRPYNDESTQDFLQTTGFDKVNVAAQGMNVPDRILVAGHDQHMGFRDQRPRELDFDDMLYGFRTQPAVAVQTPPRTLTVNQHAFPTSNGAEDDQYDQFADGPMIAPFSASALSDNMEQSFQAEKNMSMSTVSTVRQPKNSALRPTAAMTPGGLRGPVPDTPSGRLVVDLYKRVEALERENYHRYLREMVGCALLIGFVALKGMSFFLKR